MMDVDGVFNVGDGDDEDKEDDEEDDDMDEDEEDDDDDIVDLEVDMEKVIGVDDLFDFGDLDDFFMFGVFI